MRHKKGKSSAEKLRTLDWNLRSVAPEPVSRPRTVHYYGQGGLDGAGCVGAEIRPHVVKTSKLPKFSFIKTAQGPSRQLLPGSALRKCDVTPQPSSPHHPRPLQPASTPSVTWGSPPLDTLSSLISDRCSRDRGTRSVGRLWKIRGHRHPSAKNRNQSPRPGHR